MLDNLRKVDTQQLSIFFMNSKVKISSKRYCRLRLKGGGSLTSNKSLFSISLQINQKNTSKFPANLRHRFTNKYIVFTAFFFNSLNTFLKINGKTLPANIFSL